MLLGDIAVTPRRGRCRGAGRRSYRSIGTLFVIPLLALERCAPRDCFRRSATTFRDRRQRWLISRLCDGVHRFAAAVLSIGGRAWVRSPAAAFPPPRLPQAPPESRSSARCSSADRWFATSMRSSCTAALTGQSDAVFSSRHAELAARLFALRRRRAGAGSGRRRHAPRTRRRRPLRYFGCGRPRTAAAAAVLPGYAVLLAGLVSMTVAPMAARAHGLTPCARSRTVERPWRAAHPAESEPPAVTSARSDAPRANRSGVVPVCTYRTTCPRAITVSPTSWRSPANPFAV